ncbi:general odorant-binding protein 19d-like [Halictus rubicundus]|uniref:general odorant-binding protein 19d-like n=1 Tax=Halictus rubicundus TaxID=77578 RepID=UPI0040357FA6
MNIATAIVIVFAATFVGADIIDLYVEQVKGPLITCGKEYGLIGETAREVFDQDAAMGMVGATCLRACTMKAVGLMKDSKLDQQMLETFVKAVHVDDPEKIPVMQKAVVECLEKAKPLSDECKIAYSFGDCFFDKH